MNIQAVSFKGKYIVNGTSRNVDKAEKIVKNQVPLSTFKVDYGRNKTMAIFATEEDSDVLSRELKRNPKLKRMDSQKTLTENMQAVLGRVFLKHNDVKQTKIITAENIINVTQREKEYFFHYTSGHFADKEHLCLDGNYRTYYANGRVAGLRRQDGSTEEYYSDGTIYKQTNADGSEKRFFEDGFLQYEKKPDGSSLEYYSNGSLKSETDLKGRKIAYHVDGSIKSITTEDGQKQELYETGKLEKVVNQDGSYTTYFSNGNVHEVIDANGVGKTYDEDGNMIAEKKQDGSKNEYYPNGHIKATISPDLTVVTYYENSRVKSIINPDSTLSMYDEEGFLTVKKDTEGLMHEYTYDDKKLLTEEKISNGEINYFQNGVWLSKRNPDGTVYSYAPYKGKKGMYSAYKSIPGYTRLHGYTRSIKSPDGSIKYFNEKGEIIAEKTASGKYTRFSNS